VDGELLAGLFGLDPALYRPRPSRKQCGCSESIDIGMYDTCPHACVYCYANAGSRAFVNYRNHDPDSPALISPGFGRPQRISFPARAAGKMYHSGEFNEKKPE
ncbi:MAG: DUF1848 family protein, partial [Desulfotomaculales bacterium]